MKKHVFYFTMVRTGANSMGNIWQGHGWIAGNFYIVDSIFNGYSKKEIARILKNKIIEKAGFKI